MSQVKIEEVRITLIKTDYYARAGLDRDRVNYFEQLYLNHKDVPPIILSKSKTPDLDYQIIEGRHRKQAMENLNMSHALCIFEEVENKEEIYLRGLECNSGGAKPSTEEDISHVIGKLIRSGMSRSAVVKNIGERTNIPYRYVEMLYVGQSNKILKQKLSDAARSVLADGLTVPEAAKKHGITEKQLQTRMGLKSTASEKSINNIKSIISSRYQSLGITISHEVNDALKRYDNGDVDQFFIENILDKIDFLVRKMVNAQKERRSRFNAMIRKY